MWVSWSPLWCFQLLENCLWEPERNTTAVAGGNDLNFVLVDQVEQTLVVAGGSGSGSSED